MLCLGVVLSLPIQAMSGANTSEANTTAIVGTPDDPQQYLQMDSLLQKELLHAQQNHLYLEQAQVLSKLGNLYSTLYKYPEAIRYLQQAYELFLRQGHHTQAALAQYQIGLVYYKTNYKEGKACFQRALQLGADSLPVVEKISSYNTLGMIEDRDFHFPEALAYYQKALEIAVQAGNDGWIGTIHGNMGQILVQMGQTEKALSYLQKDLKASLQHQDFLSALAACFSISRIYRQRGDRANAFLSLRQAEELALKTHSFLMLKLIYKEWADIYEKQQQPEQALAYLHKYMQANDSLDKENQEVTIIRTQSAFDLQKKENQLQLVRMEYERKEQIARFILIALGLLLFCSVLGLLLYQKNKINRLLNLQTMNLEKEVLLRTQKLQSYNDQLREFAFFNSHGVRSVVARMLGLGQLLELGDLTEQEQRLYIEKLIESARQMDQELTKINIFLEELTVSHHLDQS
jgi:tetratricopeptide (TPR) repeat protein